MQNWKMERYPSYKNDDSAICIKLKKINDLKVFCNPFSYFELKGGFSMGLFLSIFLGLEQAM